MPKVFTASYRAMMGSSEANGFIARAGLGIDGVFEPIHYTVSWKPGVVVDEARAKTVEAVLCDAINAQGTFQCRQVELMTLTEKEGPPL